LAWGVWLLSEAALSQKIVDRPVAEVESIVETNCIADDIWRESVAFVCIHGPILTVMAD
jgi:hypothetical protein